MDEAPAAAASCSLECRRESRRRRELSGLRRRESRNIVAVRAVRPRVTRGSNTDLTDHFARSVIHRRVRSRGLSLGNRRSRMCISQTGLYKCSTNNEGRIVAKTTREQEDGRLVLPTPRWPADEKVESAQLQLAWSCRQRKIERRGRPHVLTRPTKTNGGPLLR